MSDFLYQYNQKDGVSFNSVIEQANPAVAFLVGQMGADGLLAAVSDDGNPTYIQRYPFKGSTCKLFNGVAADNGEFLLFGSLGKEEAEQALVIRVKPEGNVIWAKKYHHSSSTGFLNLVALGKEEYVFGSRFRSWDGKGNFELVKINGEGDVVAGQRVEAPSDELAVGLKAHKGRLLVFGGSDGERQGGNFFVQLDGGLQVQIAKLVGDQEFQVAQDVLFLDEKQLLVAGKHGSEQESFVFRFDLSQSAVDARAYTLAKGETSDFKKWQPVGDSFLLLDHYQSNSLSTFTRFGSSLLPEDHRRVKVSDKFTLSDLLALPGRSGDLLSCGENAEEGEGGLLLRSGLEFEVCAAEKAELGEGRSLRYKVQEWRVSQKATRTKAEKLELSALKDSVEQEDLCAENLNFLAIQRDYQSPFVYLQAAGSDGRDHTVKGFHLRWAFRKFLGDEHLPKGNLAGASGPYPASHGFNRSLDFVKIYRAEFNEQYYTDLDLRNQPTKIITSGSVREWEYDQLVAQGFTSGPFSKAVISFPDAQLYDSTAAATNPNASALNFLKKYSGEINVRLDEKLCFRIEFGLNLVDPNDMGSVQLRYELVSLEDKTDTSTRKLNCRETMDQNNYNQRPIMVCEDIEMVRFDRNNTYPEFIRFYTYEHFILGTFSRNAWSFLGDFSLTLDQGVAYNRLEDTSRFQINGTWPKFNQENAATGEFTVKTENYQNRWSSTKGLAYGVQRYLQLSQSASNLSAAEVVNADPIGDLNDNSSMEVSYFDLLQVVGIDFHMARMLGLGHIDADSKARPNNSYVYLMEYDTFADLQDGGGARQVRHYYMTPHLNIEDYKLPPVPALETPVTYGLTVDNATANPTALTNAEGYANFADLRFVNLNRLPFQYEVPFGPFFAGSLPFHLCDETIPVAFGVEYKEQSGAFVAPEINHESDYTDPSGIPETMIVPNAETNPVFRHQETKEGVHCYALYSVNWFSRPSDVSNEVCTDYTRFPKRNTLQPPSNLAVQLVQSESPPILTTAQEQSDYSGLSGDKTYLRVSFDWNYLHNQAYQYADKAQFFFKKEEKQVVTGKIATVTALSGHRVQVTTTSYTITSSLPAQVVNPNIAPGNEGQFKGSLFAVDGRNYRVEQVLSTTGTGGLNPTFILHEIRETNSVETPTGSNVWTTTETYVQPSVGERFLVSENLGVGAHWDNKLAKTVHLERFGTNDDLDIVSSTNNNGNYTIVSAVLSGGNTKVTVKEDLNASVVDGRVKYCKIHRVLGFNTDETGYLIAGNVTADFSGVTDITLFGSHDNDGAYTLASVSLNGSNTEVVFNESLWPNHSHACLAIDKQVNVVAYDATNKIITINGDQAAELQPTYKEIRTNTDGTTTELVMGGFVGTCNIVEMEDVYNPDNVTGSFSPGDPIAGSRTGVYTFKFSGNPLPPHIDPEVSWFRGKVRVLEDDTFLPTPLDSRTTARMKVLDVWNVQEDNLGNLILTVSDPSFEVDGSYAPAGEYVPILKGTGIQINYHPSYILYLKVDQTPIQNGTTSNEFKEGTILPSFGDGSRKTFLGIRALDGKNNDPSVDDCVSAVSTPAAIIAQEIRDPLPPNPPQGPLYATRPDFYGKSTYTVDISFNNVPYSVLVYKANERKILDTLYKPATVESILSDMAAIPSPDAYFTSRWNELVNVVLETSGPNIGEFKAYANSSFRFRIPDNPDYIIPQSFTTNAPIAPFNGTDAPGSAVTFSIPDHPILTMKQVVEQAIASAFVSQTEAPMIYEHLKSGTQTSNAKPRLRDDNDDLIDPNSGNALYDPTPFARKLGSGNLRFTDYNIDGGSISHYFYYAVELSDRQIKSPPSGIVGPVQLVNTRPAKSPNIRKAVVRLSDPLQGISPAVRFEITPYIPSEKISEIAIYRADNEIDALTVRSMDLVATVPMVFDINGVDISDYIDDFSNDPFPLYGEKLHYRLVAYREITLEDGVTTEMIPSEPSRFERAQLVDLDNPLAPVLISENGVTTASAMENVILRWEATCYNGTYVLDKLSADGNWTEIYRTQVKSGAMQYPPLDMGSPDFTNYPETASLKRKDALGDPLFHSFRVRVVNSSGLLNLEQAPLSLDQGCSDLLQLDKIADYTDGNGHAQPALQSAEIDDGPKNPITMTFSDILSGGPLPAGHNTITGIDVTVQDEFLNRVTKALPLSGSVTFNNGDSDNAGESLELSTSNENQKYTVVLTVKSDTCPDGQDFSYSLDYVSGPCRELSKLAELVECTDGNGSGFTVEASNEVDDGTNFFPNSLTFSDLVDHGALAQTATTYELTLSDGKGGVSTKTLPVSGNVTFNDGDGGLDLVGHQVFNLRVRLETVECTDGIVVDHSIIYAKDLCEDLYVLTSLVNFQDGQGNSFGLEEDQYEITSGPAYPDSITVNSVISGSVPSGHVFDRIEVVVEDDFIGEHSLDINSVAGSVVFNHDDGDLELDSDATNRSYFITATLYTDVCTAGYSIRSVIVYNI